MAEETVLNPVQTKAPWQSKTIVLNSVVGLLMALAPFVPVLAPIVAWINANGILIGSIWAAANVVLRFISKDKIQLGE